MNKMVVSDSLHEFHESVWICRLMTLNKSWIILDAFHSGSVSDNFTFAVVLNQLIFEAKDFVSGLVFSPKLFVNIPSQNICTLYSLRISILLLFYFSLEKRQDYLVVGDSDHENQCLLTELTVPLWTQKEFLLSVTAVPSLSASDGLLDAMLF